MTRLSRDGHIFCKKNAKCFVYWNKFAIFAVTIDSKQTIILK